MDEITKNIFYKFTKFYTFPTPLQLALFENLTEQEFKFVIAVNLAVCSKYFFKCAEI